MKLQFGTDLTLLSVFRHWKDVAVQAMVQAGTHIITIKWGSEENVRQLILSQEREVRLEDPEDTIMDLAEYIAKFGDYRTNGRGGF